MEAATIIVRFAAEGWHRWADARGRREYLAAKHRHMFHVEVRCEVRHDDREIEFHDLLDAAKLHFGRRGPDFGDASCEMLARWLGADLARRFFRAFTVSVFEDGEVGAEVIAPAVAA